MKILAGMVGGVLAATTLNAIAAPAVEEKAVKILPIDSPAFVFSPGNWTGDEGRGGARYRQTWNPGAYLRVTWDSKTPKPSATLLLDTSGHTFSFQSPRIAYAIDGVWHSKISCAPEVKIENIRGAGHHELTVLLHWSIQKERWGAEGRSGKNVLRVTGLRVGAEDTPAIQAKGNGWALIVGDSITEGCGASELSAYSHLVGQALLARGYEYGINACGWSGWINRGDRPPGDVPGYYVIRGSGDGSRGQYDDAASRWNKLDGNGHSLLNARGRISAYGETGQEPALILINYGTNDILHKSNPSDTEASINQCLAALRASAPDAQIVVLVPFGQYYAKQLRRAVEARQTGAPADKKISLVDLGTGVAKNLATKGGLMGGLHPNDRGHANFSAAIIPHIMARLPQTK